MLLRGVLGDNRCVDAAAHVEFGFQAGVAGGDGLDQVVEDLVGHIFVKCALIAEAPQV